MWQVWIETEETGRTGDMKYVASAHLKRDAIRKAAKFKRAHPDKIVQVQRSDGDTRSVTPIELEG